MEMPDNKPKGPYNEEGQELTATELAMMRNVRARSKELSENSKLGIYIESEYQPSYTVVENFLLDVQDLSANKIYLLIKLCRYAGRSNQQYNSLAFPSIQTLMRGCGASKNTIIKNLRFLEWLGWVTKEIRFNTKGENMSNNYTLRFSHIRDTIAVFESINLSFKVVEDYFEAIYRAKPDALSGNSPIFFEVGYKLGDEKKSLEDTLAAIAAEKRK